MHYKYFISFFIEYLHLSKNIISFTGIAFKCEAGMTEQSARKPLIILFHRFRPKLFEYVVRIVKKIQTDGKGRSERKQVKKMQEKIKIHLKFLSILTSIIC